MEIPNDDKVWVTLSRTINIGDYNSIKIEMGLTQSVKRKEDPYALLEEISTGICEAMMEQSLQFMEEVKPTPKKKKYKRPDNTNDND